MAKIAQRQVPTEDVAALKSWTLTGVEPTVAERCLAAAEMQGILNMNQYLNVCLAEHHGLRDLVTELRAEKPRKSSRTTRRFPSSFRPRKPLADRLTAHAKKRSLSARQYLNVSLAEIHLAPRATHAGNKTSVSQQGPLQLIA